MSRLSQEPSAIVKPQVLILCSHPGLSRIMALSLTRREYDVATVAQPLEFIERLRSQRYSAVVLDDSISDDEIAEAFAYLASKHRAALFPIVITQCEGHEVASPRILRVRTHYMIKPFAIADIGKLLDWLLRPESGVIIY